MAKRYKIGDIAPRSECIVFKGAKSTSGYGMINREGKAQCAHRWLWIQKYGPIPDGKILCHHCDNPRCVNLEHLFLGTQKDNMRDMLLKGRKRNIARGEHHGRSKLTDEKVVGIRKDFREGMSVTEISEKYDISRTPIYRILQGKTWTHVKDTKDGQ